MQEVHFQSLDLNLLRVFDTLAEERSVTKAGERLGLTQSAISHALNRLRYALDDELFIRGPDGMRPTPRASEVWPELRRGLAQLQHALTPTEFNPAQAHRVFQVMATAYVCEVMMPRVIARIRVEAPGVALHLRGHEPGLAEAVESGRIDLAVGVFGRIAGVFGREHLFDEHLVWAVGAHHPAVTASDPQVALLASPVMLLAPATESQNDRAGRGIERVAIWDDLSSDASPLGPNARQRIKMVVDNAHAALAIVGQTDMAALAPRRLAEALGESHGLKLFDMAPEGRPVARFESIWRADQSNHPALGWLRRILREASLDA